MRGRYAIREREIAIGEDEEAYPDGATAAGVLLRTR